MSTVSMEAMARDQRLCEEEKLPQGLKHHHTCRDVVSLETI